MPEERRDTAVDAATAILRTCDIKLMAGSQLRPYDSIERTSPVLKGSNVNCIANR